MSKIGCVLLAAGSGTRFGGDKLLYELDGVSMAERACRLHASIPYAARTLVMRPGDERLLALAARYGFTASVNPHAERGIGTSAAIGASVMQASGCPLDGVLFAVCDQPYLTAASVKRLIETFERDAYRIVAPAFRGSRGNPVLFPASLLPAFCELSNDVGGGAIIRSHPSLLSLVELESEQELQDIDYRHS